MNQQEPAAEPTEAAVNNTSLTRVVRFEVKPVSRDKDRDQAMARIQHASDELRAAMNRAMMVLIGLKLGTIVWPVEPGKKGKNKGVAGKVPVNTLAYRLVAGNWQPEGAAPCYQPAPSEPRTYTRKDGTTVQVPPVYVPLSGAALSVAAGVLATRLKTDWRDILHGKKSAPTFKSVPLGCTAQTATLHDDGRITLALWSGDDPATKRNNKVTVRPIRLDGHTASVLARLRDGTYKLGNVVLTWTAPKNRKGKLFVNIQWTGPVQVDKPLDPMLWAGVDIGVDHLAAIVIFNEAATNPRERFSKAGLVPHPEQIMRVLRRRQRELRQRRTHYTFVQGRGRAKATRGYGVAEDQIQRVMTTAFRQAASDVIRRVVAAGAGNLVVEDHKNWSIRKALDWGDDETAARRARFRRGYLRWHQGLFAQLLQQQGELAGLTVHSIDPAWSSRTCSACGIEWKHTGVYTPKPGEAKSTSKRVTATNRKGKRGTTVGSGAPPIPEGTDATGWGRYERSKFRCTCGYHGHADVNAARNLAKWGAERANNNEKE